MKYFVQVGLRTFEVVITGEQMTIDGEPVEPHLDAIPATPLHHLLMGGESWTVAVEPPIGAAIGAPWVLSAAGERHEITVVDERTRQVQELTGRRAGPPATGIVRSPMPGLVVRVEVQVGDQVALGAGLVVVEAMKMENELRAGGAGLVTEVHVVAGAAVEKGAPLVTLQLTAP